MNIEEVREWMEIADRDFDSAQILNEAVRRHYEVICYLCATDIRYPNRYEVTESDVKLAINAVEKVRNSKPILDLRNINSNN